MEKDTLRGTPIKHKCDAELIDGNMKITGEGFFDTKNMKCLGTPAV